ncbi:glycosyltransferase [Candidatus Pacearchaeota archaeon]|nr:glycosyltransferase [Candidatus Pacearchaeota archaeon]
MKNNYKISFLIPAHNEEKIIATTISHLLKIPYDNYEVIIGLDGCTDKTEEIVKNFCKKSSKVRYYKLNLRQGKPAVIDSIIKKALGKIVFINDADWTYEIKDNKMFEKFLSVFNDKKIGGIAESFPAEWHRDRLKKGDIGYKMEAYSSYFWLKYQKKRFTYKKGRIRYLKEPTMFLTNIFRKKLYKPNFSLGDDFERTHYIIKNGYQVVLFDDPNMPRIKTTYYQTKLKDSFNQKIRTAVARKQLKSKEVFNIGIKDYYLPVTWYIFKEAWKTNIKIGFIISFWVAMTITATIIAKFKKIGTKEGWKIRIKR